MCGDEGGAVVRVWNRRTGCKAEGDEEHVIEKVKGGHGGADPEIVGEFLRWVRYGEKISTSAVAARNSVAAGCAAARSLRGGGGAVEVSGVDAEVAEYFTRDVADGR